MKTPMYVSKFAIVTCILLAAAHVRGQAPPTPEKTLARLGIKTDQQSLINALKDPRPVARGVAAAVLGYMNSTGAIPEIESALNVEHDPKVAYNMAVSLVDLKAPKAEDRLEAYCKNLKSPAYFRFRAADILADRGNYKCLGAMADYLTSQDAGVREGALVYMTHVPSPQKDAPASLGSKLLAVAANDPIPYFRKLAGQAIMQIGDEKTKAAYEELRAKQEPH